MNSFSSQYHVNANKTKMPKKVLIERSSSESVTKISAKHVVHALNYNEYSTDTSTETHAKSEVGKKSTRISPENVSKVKIVKVDKSPNDNSERSLNEIWDNVGLNNYSEKSNKYYPQHKINDNAKQLQKELAKKSSVKEAEISATHKVYASVDNECSPMSQTPKCEIERKTLSISSENSTEREINNSNKSSIALKSPAAAVVSKSSERSGSIDEYMCRTRCSCHKCQAFHKRIQLLSNFKNC